MAHSTRRAATFTLPASGRNDPHQRAALDDSSGHPAAGRALIVEDTPAMAVDRDEVLLIEDWR
jgi:hypothetical protein